MIRTTSPVVAVSIVIMLVCLMTKDASALQCYACDSSSSPQCSENYFVGLVNTVADGCTCCRKSVSDGVTKRECVTGLASVTCIPLPNNHICSDVDKCNDSTALRGSNGLIMVLVGTAAVTLAMIARGNGHQ